MVDLVTQWGNHRHELVGIRDAKSCNEQDLDFPQTLSCPLSHTESSLFLCPEGTGPERGRALLPAELALRAEQDENLGGAV